MNLAEAVRELYALGPAEFIGTRDRLSKAAKADGDPGLAGTVKKLKKPSAGAWLANMLALHRQADLLPVLELGEAMREAQDELDGDELRRLGRERNGIVAAALRSARQLADQLDQQVGDAAVNDLEQTLRAALNDTEATAAVASGQLIRGLTATGLGPVDLDGALADPASVPPVPVLQNHRLRQVATAAIDETDETDETDEPHGAEEPAVTKPDRQAEQRARVAAERRDRERAEAEQRVAETRAAAEGLDHELADARAEVTRTSAEYERIATRLAKLREQVVTLDQQAKKARQQHRDAQKTQRLLKPPTP